MAVCVGHVVLFDGLRRARQRLRCGRRAHRVGGLLFSCGRPYRESVSKVVLLLCTSVYALCTCWPHIIRAAGFCDPGVRARFDCLRDGQHRPARAPGVRGQR